MEQDDKEFVLNEQTILTYCPLPLWPRASLLEDRGGSIIFACASSCAAHIAAPIVLVKLNSKPTSGM